MKLIETTMEKVVIEFSSEEFSALVATIFSASTSFDQIDPIPFDLTEEQVDLINAGLHDVADEANKKRRS